MADTSPNTPAKPGTACLGCRRRKLKCSREQEGCSHCLKSALPCVYPAPEGGVKRKRGPYKKDKSTRERHLEDLVKYLEPNVSQLNDNHHSATTENESPSLTRVASAGATLPMQMTDGRHTEATDDLVKDALNALTKSAAIEKEIAMENEMFVSRAVTPSSFQIGRLGTHPSNRLIFEYWQLFVARVDPLLKIIHCPSFLKSILKGLDDLLNTDITTETLMFSIYYAATVTCTPREAYARFGEHRTTLLRRFGRVIESALSDNYSMPTLGSLQALVIYIIAIRREDTISSLRALFSLAVRVAQLIGLQKDPGDFYGPLEAELRRRLWWHICSLESRGAEESGSRTTSIMEDARVQIPSNYFDFDLEPNAKIPPQPRTGASDLVFPLLRCETMVLSHQIWAVRKKLTTGSRASSNDYVKSEQRKLLAESKTRLETVYLQYLNESRPYDWLCLKFAETILIKVRLMIEHPFGQIPSNKMSKDERLSLLQDSVDIIRLTQSVSKGKGLDDWVWYFRGWQQWHSVAIVVAELCSSTSAQFVMNAWSVLDPILADWDRVYEQKREEPAWDHVNTMIERARNMRQHNFNTAKVSSERLDVVPNTLAAQPVLPTSNSTIEMAISSYPQAQSLAGGSYYANQYPIQASGTVPFQTGCAPSIAGLEADIGLFDNIEDIDFAAFDAVFGDLTWDNLSTDTDFSTEMSIP